MHQHGFAIHALLADQEGKPNVIYTVGLSQLTGYELLVSMCMEAELIGGLLQVAAELAAGKRKGLPLPVADGVLEPRLGDIEIFGVKQPLRCVYRKVTDLVRAFGLMQFRVQGVETVYQLVLPDEANLLPGEAGYDDLFDQDL
jgi:hypothetical protein